MRVAAVMSILDRNIGRCPRCMKIAFICALGAWLLYLSARLAWPQHDHLALAAIVPIAFTGLWLAHATTYGLRVLRTLRSEYLGPAPIASADCTSVSAQRMSTRRSLLWVVSTAVTVTMAGALWLPARAFAAGHPCGEGRNCPDDAPNCCSRSAGKCCDGNWACVSLGKCYAKHEDARNACGSGTVWACS